MWNEEHERTPQGAEEFKFKENNENSDLNKAQETLKKATDELIEKLRKEMVQYTGYTEEQKIQNVMQLRQHIDEFTQSVRETAREWTEFDLEQDKK